MKITSMKQILQYYVSRMKNRFWKYVNKTETCWLWTGSKDTRGYGQYVICGQLQVAHRSAWIIQSGRIPDGLHVLHKCDIRLCVRKDHLFLGTNTDNYLDKMAKKRHAFGENHNHAKMTEKQVLEIRKRKSNEKISNSSLAKEYGLSATGIQAIVDRRTWRHI